QTSVVLLGEATHGTTEFYDARRRSRVQHRRGRGRLAGPRAERARPRRPCRTFARARYRRDLPPETALFPGRAVAAIRCLDLAHRDERRRRERDHRPCRRTQRKLSFRPLSSPPYSFHIIAVL